MSARTLDLAVGLAASQRNVGIDGSEQGKGRGVPSGRSAV